MEIFTEEVKKEIKRFLPHYFLGSCFLMVSIIFAGVICITFNHTFNIISAEYSIKQKSFVEKKNLLPSEYQIGKPFSEAIKDKTKPLVVEFYADWCPHSKKLTPVFYWVSLDVDNANFTTVNTQLKESEYLIKKFKIDKFPTILVIDTKTETAKELPIGEKSFIYDDLLKQVNDAINQL